MKSKLLYIIIILTLSGCDDIQYGIEHEITNSIQEKCKDSPDCNINLVDIIEFDWDTMFYFKYNVTEDRIESITGKKIDNFTEFKRKVLFISDESIVYYEELQTNIEGIINGQIIFVPSDTSDYTIITSQDAKFTAVKQKSGNNFYYELRKPK